MTSLLTKINLKISNTIKVKLIPLQTNGSMEPVLISVSCSVKHMRVFDPPGWNTNPLQASSQQALDINQSCNDQKLRQF